MNAEVTRLSVFDMQVCVPTDWSDEQVKEFADKKNPLLKGDPERNPCGSRQGFVHIMLDA